MATTPRLIEALRERPRSRAIMDVFIADDSRLVRERLVAMLADIDGIRLVGEAADIQSAVEGVRTLRPQTLILDVELPGGTGIDVLKAIAGAQPMPRVIMLTNNPLPAYREKCRRAGAEFFFDKTLEFEKVAQVLRVLRATVAAVPATETDPVPGTKAPETSSATSAASRTDAVSNAALIAAQVCGARHAFLRINPIDFPWVPVTGPRRSEESLLLSSLCAQAVKSGELVLVDDVLRESRAGETLLACGNGPMRFFAAVPLVMSGDAILGTLVVLDPEPRSLSNLQQQVLGALARQTVSTLELLRLEYERARRDATAPLQRPPTRDALTGLQNRAALNESVMRGIAHASRYAEKLGFFYINIDHFRRLNETCGREVGDAVLVETGKRLLAAVRGVDTVARLGGDEFAVLAQGLRSAEDAAMVARKLHRMLSIPFDNGAHRWAPSCSIGVSVFPVDGSDGEALLRHADAAMYRAKSAGRGGYELFAASPPRKAS